jgi:hypothetical protein
MRFFAIYLCVGFVVYLALALVFIKTGVDRKGLNKLWWGWLMSGEFIGAVLGLLFWPFVAALSLFRWRTDMLQPNDESQNAEDNEEERKHRHSYMPSRLDERLAEQKRAVRNAPREVEGNGKAL